MKKPEENKAKLPAEDKDPYPPALSPDAQNASGEREPGKGSGKVKIRMKPGRTAEGIGPGETAEVSRHLAEYLISINYATEEE